MTQLLRILVEETGLSRDDLVRIIRSAPRRYKVFEIPKRSGGMREIAQPAREVKLLQRVLLQRVLGELPVHPAARAYRAGMSILDNARPHLGHGPILKMDFVDFFPSIRATDWEAYCAAHNVLDPEDRPLASNILFRLAKGDRLLKLSIGAPSSPALSNLLMFSFDEMVSQEAARRRIAYSRYADDLTFSGQRAGMLRDMVGVVETVTRSIQWPRLRVHPEKTTYVTSRWKRVVTGVVLANDGMPSLGRARKRLISAKVHHALLGRLNEKEMASLAGHLAFAKAIEPAFIVRLEAKYGLRIVRQIQHSVAIPEEPAPAPEAEE